MADLSAWSVCGRGACDRACPSHWPCGRSRAVLDRPEAAAEGDGSGDRPRNYLHDGDLLVRDPLSRMLFGGEYGPEVAEAIVPLALVTPLAFVAFLATMTIAVERTGRRWILVANGLGAAGNRLYCSPACPETELREPPRQRQLASPSQASCSLGGLSNRPFVGSSHGPDRGRRRASHEMRVLVVTSRFPEPGKRGDQSRAFAFLSFLAQRHELSIVSGGSASSPEAGHELVSRCELTVPPVRRGDRARSAIAARFAAIQAKWAG